jgi:hypothetical protein
MSDKKQKKIVFKFTFVKNSFQLNLCEKKNGFQLDLCEEIAFNFTFMKNGFQLYLCEKYFSTLPL